MGSAHAHPARPLLSPASRDVTWDYLIVGAGFAGAVLAERLASQCGATCLVIDRRGHIGGNAFDHCDEAGVLLWSGNNVGYFGPYETKLRGTMPRGHMERRTRPCCIAAR